MLMVWCRGLGAVVAEKFAAEGSNIVINYVSNKEAADQVTAKIEKEHKVKVAVVQGVRISLSLSQATSLLGCQTKNGTL